MFGSLLGALFAAALAVITGTIYFFFYSPQANQPDIHPLQLSQQSFAGSTRESAHESAVHRSKSTPEDAPLLKTPANNLNSLRDLLRIGRRVHREDAIKHIVKDKVQKLTSEDIAARSISLAGGLLRIHPSSSSAVIYLPSSPEFLIAYQACIEAGIVAIPISPSETTESVASILKHSKSQILITSDSLAMGISAAIPSTSVTHVVVTTELDGSDAASVVRNAANVVVLDTLTQGEAPEKDAVIESSDAAYVIYTVDDPSRPQGVVITHANALAAVAGLLSNLPASHSLTEKDSYLCLSPVSSAANLNFVNLALMHGCSISTLDTIDAEVFAAQCYDLAPTFTYLGPLITRDLVQLFYSTIRKYPKLEYNMFMRGYQSMLDYLMRGMTPKANFWDFFYFRHYRNVIGGKFRLMFVDGPTTPSKSMEWLRVLHGARVIPIFGTAQTTAVVTAGAFYDYASAIDTHNVGAPLACNEIKVVDSKDIAFTADDKPYGRGNIVVRGANISTQLWNDDTAVETTDGWLKLRYYGELLPNGTIEVIGSHETVVKSSLEPTTGIIEIERLERALATSRAVTDICVVSLSGKLGIVVHPRPMELFGAAKRMKKEYKLKEIDNYPWCADYIRDRLIETAGANGYEWLSEISETLKVKLVSESFKVSNRMSLSDGTNNRVYLKSLLYGKSK